MAMKLFAVFTFILVCPTSLTVLPFYSPSIRNNAAVMRDERIENYFNIGLSATEIALFLASVHGVSGSLEKNTQTVGVYKQPRSQGFSLEGGRGEKT